MAISTKPSSGYLGTKPFSNPIDKFTVIDGVATEIHNVVVHRFKIRDLDDPEIYAAGLITEWLSSEQGQWVQEHAIESLQWHTLDDARSFHVDFAITAKLKDVDYMIWVLKFQ